MTFTQLRFTFLWSMVGSLSLTALIGVLVLIFPTWGPEDEILVSTLVFGAFSLVALMCAAALEKGRLVPLMWGGIGASVAAVAGWLVLIWFWQSLGSPAEEHVARTAGTFSVAAAAIGHVGVMGVMRFDEPRMLLVRRVTIGGAVTLAAYAVVLIWFFEPIEDFIDDDEILVRTLGVLGILTACGTIVTPILWKVQAVRRATAAGAVPSRVTLEIVCPRCSKRQQIRAGRGRCASCGLRINIEVEEPRCVCGYLLYQLETDRCPECGRPVRSSPPS